MLDYCHHSEQTLPLLWIHISIFITILCQVVPSSMMGVHGACGKKEYCCICSMLLSNSLGRFLLVQNPLDGQGQRKFCCLSSWVKMSQLVSSSIAALIAILPAAPSSSSSWQPYPEASSNHPGVASISLDIITSSTLDTPDSWLNYTRIVKAEQAWDPDANSNLDLTSTSINPTSALRVENQMLFTFPLKALLSVVVENSEALLGLL